MDNIFRETLYKDYAQQFKIEKILYKKSTGLHELMVFENTYFGRIMTLDGIVQTTEVDEFIYHEMFTHVPIFAHGNIKNVLVIGGGDGGVLREVMKHKDIESVVQVEIDLSVIEISKEFLPKHSAGAFDDKRLTIEIDDGLNFVKNTQTKFDLIITDSTDPIGPGEVLFTEEYYKSCRGCLNDDGILVTQNGVTFANIDTIKKSGSYFAKHFKDWSFYRAAVPVYIPGEMTFGFASDNKIFREVPYQTLCDRFEKSQIETKCYNPGMHISALCLPTFLQKAIQQG